MEITVYKNCADLAKNKWLLNASISCPDTFDFMACVSMFKNLYPGCSLMFTV